MTAKFTLARAAAWLDARILPPGADAPICGVATDTRSLEPGTLFVALQGPNFDAHDFVADAAERGAVAALVQRPLEIELPQLLVTDTRAALAALAAAWRQTLPGKVVAITGSNGKTTTREMVAAILAGAGSVMATRGNLNNDVGLPLTLLGCAEQDYLVLEMGANHSGEIAALTAVGRPDVALITNAGRAHLEGFGSIEGVARAKGEIIQGLGADGVFVLNADDPWSDLWREMAAGRRVLSFGLDAAAEVRIEATTNPLRLNGDGFSNDFRLRTPRGILETRLRLAGRHNLMNALAATAVAEALALDTGRLLAALAGLRPVAGRLAPRSGLRGCRLIDDSYNANPDSVAAALEVLAALPGRRWLLLGELAELGPTAAELHRQIGRAARLAGIERLYTVGPLAGAAAETFGAGARRFDTRDSLIDALRPDLDSDDLILVKGSRSAAMDRVVAALTADEGN